MTIQTGKSEKRKKPHHDESGLSRKVKRLVRKPPEHPRLKEEHVGDDKGVYFGMK